MQSLSFRVDGSVIRLETDSQALLEETAKDFSRFAYSGVLEPQGRVLLTRSRKRFPIRVPEYAVRDSFGPNESAVYTHLDKRYVTVGDSCAFEIDLRGSSIEGYFRPDYPVWPFFRHMLKWFLIKNLERRGIHFLHASSGISDDLCVLFVAPSGFGKTSALLSLLRGGYHMITDDLFFFEGRTVYPFHMRSMIHKDVPERYPFVRDTLKDPLTSEADGGWHVDLETMFGAVREPFEPQKLLVLHLYVWNSSETTWRPLARGQMAAKMSHAYLMELGNSFWFGWNRERVAKNVFESYFDLAEDATCYEVRAGWDLETFEGSLFSKIEEHK